MAPDEGAAKWLITSPRDAALRILAHRFRPGTPLVTSVPLADFQRESVQRASEILQHRGGVLIADSVGLGKTYVALALIDAALARDTPVLLVTPACLRRMWRTELNRLGRFGERLHLLSHSQLARVATPPSIARRLVVIDEAHAFRNPKTQRYRALRQVCRGAQVVLLTATPINNSLSDLYFQIKLFCSDRAFRDLGIGSVRSLLKQEPRPQDITRLKAAVMVRRTRADARGWAGAAPTFRFPGEALTHALTYRLPVPVPQLGEFLRRLTFPAYRACAGPGFSADVLRFSLLKRMESSVRAINTTLRRQIEFYQQFIAALEQRMLLRPHAFRSLFAGDESSLQLVLDPVALDPLGVGADRSALLAAARRELETLRAWQTATRNAHDSKVLQLACLLRERGPSSKTVVFSEYRDTARYLWLHLRSSFAVGLIDGSGAWMGGTPSSRHQVVECFAPNANRAAPVHRREAINILIATDVLAEGMNLQDADAVVSYDLPWNPIRLVQRAGRVDRIGSNHDVVHVFNFIPDREFDAFLGLARTIRSKLDVVRSVIGTERPVLEPGEDFESVVRGVAAGDQRLLERVDSDEDSRLRAAYVKSPPALRDGTVPVATLTPGGGRHLLVGMVRNHETQTHLIDLETGREVDGASALLLRALEGRAPLEFEASTYLAIASRYVGEFNQQSAIASVERTSSAAKLARIIRNRLAELPLGEPHDFTRADAVLEKLATVDDWWVENELEMVARSSAARPFSALLSDLEKAFSCAKSAEDFETGWTLCGVIVAD